jgi:arylsulfatase B
MKHCLFIVTLALNLACFAADKHPNILFIVADDLGYGELTCQGNPQVPTPNIDSLAKNGTRFTSGYFTAPFCAPSRAGFITGRYQTRFGYDINPTGTANLNPNIGLPINEITLANHLKRAGYATTLVGKWHLDATEPFHPQQRSSHPARWSQFITLTYYPVQSARHLLGS